MHHYAPELSGFSALQRAENSSILTQIVPQPSQTKFQCSSASRKFLNENEIRWGKVRHRVSVLFSEPKIPQSDTRLSYFSTQRTSFSALQRAENSSIVATASQLAKASRGVSVLFSEPKIPQSSERQVQNTSTAQVSVLFSEPKIPQS